MRRRTPIVFVGVALPALVAGTARGDAKPVDAIARPAESVAETLFEAARDDMRRGAYDEAYPKLLESEHDDPSAGTLLNLLVCEEKLGKLASAWLHGREFLDRVSDMDDRRPVVEGKVAALEPRVPKLTIRLAADTPSQTEIELDGIELGASSIGMALPMDPGTHSIAVAAPGRSSIATSLSLEEGHAYVWTVPALGVATVASHVEHDRRPRAPLPRQHGKDRTWLTWTAFGTGAAGLIAAAVLGAMTLHEQSIVQATCPNKQCRDQSGLNAAADGRKFFVGTMATLAIGAAGMGTGIYLVSAQPPTKGAAPLSFVLTCSGRF